MAEGESNASMDEEEGESNASMDEEGGKSNASMVQEEEDYSLRSLYDSEGESNASMVKEAISLHAQPDEVVSSSDNALPSSVNQLVNTSVITQAVSSEPTDAEAQNLAGDSSAFSQRTQPSEDTFPYVRKSTVPLGDPTDAERPYFSGDSSAAEPDTSRDDSMRDLPFTGSTSVPLSNKPSENSDEELENLIDQMPQELNIKPVHCLIVCTKEDIDGADKFREHLIRDIKIKHGSVTAALDKGPEFFPLPGGTFSRADECFNRGILKFIYMTENLIKDEKLIHTIDSCLSESFNHEHKKWTFFPVYSRKEDKKLAFPSYLKSLQEIDYFNPDKHYRNNIASLIEHRISVYVKKNEHRRKEWITENRKTGAATGGIQETQMKSVSIPGLDTDDKKRWHTVGLCLNIVLSTALKHVGSLIEELFKDLKISKQTKDSFFEKHGNTTLSYKAINGNTNREKKEEYNYNIRNAVDFSKCLMHKQAHKYTDFNDCKLETWLYFLTDIDLPSITEDCRESAKKVVKIRNNWAHCNFSEWTDDFYRNALSLIEELLKNLKLKPEEENRFLGDLEEMKDHCRNLIHGKTCDLSLLQDLLNKTEELLKCVTEDEIVIAKIVKIIKSLKSALVTFIGQFLPK